MLSLTSSTAAAPLVLIVDDDVDSCEMYSTSVKAAGLRVSLAHDGETGLSRALRSEPDLLVTDIVMPGIDGFELTRRLRETEALQGLPVIAVTARTMTDADLTRLTVGGPTSILLKPCEPIRLLVEIWKLLHTCHVLRERASALLQRSVVARTRAFEVYGRSVIRRQEFLSLVASRRLRELEMIRDEFLVNLGLTLTPVEAAHRLGMSERTAAVLFDGLVDEGFLLFVDGRYRQT